MAEELLVRCHGGPDEPSAFTGLLSFGHGAVQQVLYGDLAPGRRTEIHHAVAIELSSLGEPAGRIAAHAVAAAEIDPGNCLRWATAAGTAATGIGAHAEAAAWFEQAADVAQAHGDRAGHVAALIARGDALRLAGSPEQEDALFEAVEAAGKLHDPNPLADATFALLQLGATTESGSIHERAIGAAEQVLAVIRDPDRRARVTGAASLTYSMTGNPDRCRALLLEALSLARRSETRRAVLPFAFLGLGHPSDLDRREELTDELLDLGRQADDPVALFEGHQLAFSVAMQRSDGSRLRASVAELDRLTLRVGDVGRRWAALYHRAAVQHLESDLVAAEATSEAAMELFAPVSPSRAIAVHGGQLLPIRIAQGRLGELREVMEALVVDQPGVPAWRAALAFAVVDDDPERAARLASSALDDVAEDFTWLAAHLIGGRAAAAAGVDTIVERYLERLLPWSGLVCWQGTCSYGPVDAVVALLQGAAGRPELALAHAEQGLAQARQLGAPVFEPELHAIIAAGSIR